MYTVTANSKSVSAPLTAGIIAIVAAGGILAQDGKGEDPAVVAALARQRLLNDVTIQFKRTDIEARGSRSASLPQAISKENSVVPDRETTTESINRVLLHADKMRFENNHPLWHLTRGTLQQTSSVAVSDGIIATTFRPRGPSGKEGPKGFIRGSGNRMNLTEPVLTPLLVTFRGAHAEINPYPVQMVKPTRIALPINGKLCKEYALDLGDFAVSYWLDPARDYALRRYAMRSKNQLIQQIDVEHRHDDEWGWLPVTWTIQEYSAQGEFLRTTNVAVAEMHVGQTPSEEEFQIRFPPDTWVSDERVKKYYRVQPDGSMREISAGAEARGSSVPQPAQGFLERHRWMLISIAVLAVIGVLFALGRGYRRRLFQ
jgi:hypothetical protein